jgi:hypothetical protein
MDFGDATLVLLAEALVARALRLVLDDRVS